MSANMSTHDLVYWVDPLLKDAINIETGIVSNYSRQDATSTRWNLRYKAVKNGWWIRATMFKKGKSIGKITHRFIKDTLTLERILDKTYVDAYDLPYKLRKKYHDCFPSKLGMTEIENRITSYMILPHPLPSVQFVDPVVSESEKPKSWGTRDFTQENKFGSKSTKELLVPNNFPTNVPDENSSEEDLIKFISKSYKYKAPFFKISELKWKILVRSVLRGQNTIITGDKGSGKTIVAFAIANSLSRRIEVFNFGNMQDAQTALIGKTFFDTTKGTYFSKSPFVDAITTPNTIILLDEFSRSSDDGYNIMFPVLDLNQRCLRLTDEVNSPKVKVAPGVCFIATANIGRGYSATRHIDDAIMDRFTTKIEVDRLSVDERVSIIRTVFPVLTVEVSELISKIVDKLNDFVYGNAGSDARDLPKPISTRAIIELASLVYDGFSVEDAIDSVIVPEYSTEGGVESDRTFVKQTIQGFINQDNKNIIKIYESQILE